MYNIKIIITFCLHIMCQISNPIKELIHHTLFLNPQNDVDCDVSIFLGRYCLKSPFSFLHDESYSE